jgi:predicted nucleic acid-binding protein
VYWDTSAFLALLKNETMHGPGVLDALKSQAGAFDRGEIVLATSTLAILEVNSADLPDSARELFEGMLRRSNMVLVAANETVMRSAAELRRHVYGKDKNGAGEPYVLSSPDAIHVVSAMQIGADCLVTLDSANKPKTKEMAMTGVSRHYPVPGMHAVPIERPALGLAGTGLLP